MTALEAAQTAVYAAFTLPLLWILRQHGLSSATGWFYLVLFCLLRVIGNAMALSGNAIGVVIASVGVAPLLLGASGVLHEARGYNKSPAAADRKAEWVAVLGFHVLASTGVALLAVGAAGMVGSDPKPDDATLEKVGVILLLLAWGVLCAASVWSFVAGKRASAVGNDRAAKMLLGSVLVADLFIGVAVLYTVVAVFRGTLLDGGESLAIEVVFSVVPDMLAAVVFIVGGLLTRNACHEMNTQKQAMSQQRGKPVQAAGYA